MVEEFQGLAGIPPAVEPLFFRPIKRRIMRRRRLRMSSLGPSAKCVLTRSSTSSLKDVHNLHVQELLDAESTPGQYRLLKIGLRHSPSGE